MEHLFSILQTYLFLLLIGVVVLVIELLRVSKIKNKQTNRTIKGSKQFAKKVVVYIIVCVILLLIEIPVLQDIVENKTYTVVGTVTEITSSHGNGGRKYAIVTEHNSIEEYKLRAPKGMIINEQIKEGKTYAFEYYKNSKVIKNATPISS